MDVTRFFPYRIYAAAEAVSRCVADVYGERFGLTRDEWRVLAALGDAGWVRTAAVIESSMLEKMQVSRATTRLERDGLIERRADPDDGRGWLVRLSASGRALFAKVMPMVLAREQFLLEGLADDERDALERALDKVAARAQLMTGAR